MHHGAGDSGLLPVDSNAGYLRFESGAGSKKLNMKRRTFETKIYHPCHSCQGTGDVKKVQQPAGSIPVDMGDEVIPYYLEPCKECMGTGKGPIKEIRIQTDITELTDKEKGLGSPRF